MREQSCINSDSEHKITSDGNCILRLLKSQVDNNYFYSTMLANFFAAFGSMVEGCAYLIGILVPATL